MQPNSSIFSSEKKMSFIRLPWIRKSISAAAVFAVFFITLEITLRIFWSPPLNTHEEFLIQHDPLLGWRKTPHALAMHKNSEYTVSEKYNSKGLRGPEYSYEKPEGEYRFLVLGDSHAEGHSVKFEDLFSEVLKRKLNTAISRVILTAKPEESEILRFSPLRSQGFATAKRGAQDDNASTSFEVINTGTGGYSTDQSLLFFQSEGRKYQPDFTILTFSLNNITYNSLPAIASWHKPLFTLEKSKLKLTRVPVPEPQQPSFHSRMRSFLKRHIYTTQFFYDWITHTSFYTILSRWGLTSFPNQFRVWQKKSIPQIEESWKLTEALLVKLQQEVEATGSRFMVFYIPVAASVYPEAWQEKQNKYAWADAEWDPLQDGRRLEALCKKHGIFMVNPTFRFRKAALNPQKNYYSFKDEHWVREGHALAAQILFEELIRR